MVCLAVYSILRGIRLRFSYILCHQSFKGKFDHDMHAQKPIATLKRISVTM